jgi:hypothetical protein
MRALKGFYCRFFTIILNIPHEENYHSYLPVYSFHYCFSQVISYYLTGEEFSGPFPSWVNVKTAFGAVGDGVHNDAPNINAALQALRIQRFSF